MTSSIIKGSNVDIKVWTTDIEASAVAQLQNVASLPWVFHHIAAMPDVHWGMGATVGSVIAMKNAVSPAAVGVDIGCGMGSIKTSLKASDLPDNLYNLRHQIERSIPVGFNAHKSTVLSEDFKLFDTFANLSPKVQKLKERALLQAGTLGGGNHFIEICLDTEDNVWLMLHSGSRNIGKSLADIHITKAKSLAHNQDLPDKELAVFLSQTPEMKDYLHDLNWAQEYAFLNRRIMFNLLIKVMNREFAGKDVTYGDPILCHHNYVSTETHFGEEVIVTRKGAIRAQIGDMGVIPGSMGTKSYIVRGLGNPESFNSASHGAGRRMSRGDAKRQFTLTDLSEQTKGVECRKDKDVLDEIPGAYKDIDQVMENQSDLVEVVAQLKGIICIKG